MGYEDLLAGADWKLAPAELVGPRALGGTRDLVAVELVAPEGARLGTAWTQQREQWIALPAHPNILEAVAISAPRGVLLRYPAIDWAYTFRPVGLEGGVQLAAWAAQLALAFTWIVKHVPREHLGRFANPSAYVDLGGHARVAFLPCAPGVGDERWPPELRRTWPAAEPHTLVYVIAAALAGLADDITHHAHTPIGEIVRHCAEPSPSRRIASPIALWRELDDRKFAGMEIRRGAVQLGWKYFEDGLGWLAVARPLRARRAFESALELGAQMKLAQVGRILAMRELGEHETHWRSTAHGPNRCAELTNAARHAWAALRGVSPARGYDGEPLVPWADVIDAGARYEAERGFAEAIAVYARSIECPDQFVAIARCYGALGKPGLAIDYASRALAIEPRRHEAQAIRGRARLAYGDPAAALADADALIAALPADGVAHYLRGRSLFALGRVSDARAAFDRACALSPQLLEALVLRGHVVRSAADTRAVVGTQPLQALDVPAHLPAVRAALATGDVAAAITALEAADPADLAAQQLLGHCLLYAGRAADALAAFGRAGSRAGEAHALLALGRADEALARFDELLAAAPDDADLASGRADALAQLGRADEARAAHDQLIRRSAVR